MLVHPPFHLYYIRSQVPQHRIHPSWPTYRLTRTQRLDRALDRYHALVSKTHPEYVNSPGLGIPNAIPEYNIGVLTDRTNRLIIVYGPVAPDFIPTAFIDFDPADIVVEHLPGLAEFERGDSEPRAPWDTFQEHTIYDFVPNHNTDYGDDYYPEIIETRHNITGYTPGSYYRSWSDPSGEVHHCYFERNTTLLIPIQDNLAHRQLVPLRDS